MECMVEETRPLLGNKPPRGRQFHIWVLQESACPLLAIAKRRIVIVG